MMIQIDDKIISRELFDSHFICHLEKCEGNCCVFGDSGAPLEENETALLEANQNSLKPFMRKEGIKEVERQGSWVVDRDGDRVTPLVNREECTYAIFDKGIARCAIELAHEAGAVPFQKPVSCHLYPIRVSKLKGTIALNYHRWSICEPARILGEIESMPVFRFLREAITRVYGSDFYHELETVYREMISSDKHDL
jgi:hypothetical protein